MNIINLENDPPNGFNLISLFAGCGGSSLGYKAAGYDIRLSVEWDKGAAQTYRDNFPGTPVFEGDVGDLSLEEVMELSGLGEGELDVLDGSPPCQGFSTAGERKFSDDRNQLFREYIRLLEGLKPKAFIMENVSGLRKGKMKLMFAEMTKALKKTGYRVECRELNAWWYGVPQTRQRLIWIGIREDLPFQPSHPKPELRRPISVKQALGFGGMIDTNQYNNQHDWYETDNPTPTMRKSKVPRVAMQTEQETVLATTPNNYNGQWNDPDEPMRTLNASNPPKLAMLKPTFRNEGKSRDGSEPSYTLDATRPPKLAGSFSFPQNVHKNGKSLDQPSGTLAVIRPPSITDGMEVRFITIEEAKILQSFPESFKISKYDYIGNSVPPLMAKAIGKQVARILSGELQDA